MISFVNFREDVIPHNFAVAVDAIKQYNVMPVYGEPFLLLLFIDTKARKLLTLSVKDIHYVLHLKYPSELIIL